MCIRDRSNFINGFSTQLKQSQSRLNEIDEKGIFQSDDEIGWFFKEIKQIQNNLLRFKSNQ